MKEQEKIATKENKFILDCTNILKCQKKEYNPLFDENCASYLLKNNHIKHLQNIGFINKNGVILKDPDNIRKKENKNSNINSLKNIVKNRILTENNFFLRNNSKKISLSRTSYNTINTNCDTSKENKNTPKFMSVFSPIFDNNKILISPKLKTLCHLPKMPKNNYNLSNQLKSHNHNNNVFNLRKSNSMGGRNNNNNNNIFKKKKNFSYNNSKFINKNNIYQILNSNDNNYLPRIIKTIMSKK